MNFEIISKYPSKVLNFFGHSILAIVMSLPPASDSAYPSPPHWHDGGGGPPGRSTAAIRTLALHPSLHHAACLAEEASVSASPLIPASNKGKGYPSSKGLAGMQWETMNH